MSLVALELSLGADTLPAFFLLHQVFGGSPEQPVSITPPRKRVVRKSVTLDMAELLIVGIGLRSV